MPHARQRFIEKLVLKRLKGSPVLALQGARQVGKSFFVRELLKQKYKTLKYLTLDKKAERDYASTNPDTFLAQHLDQGLFVIDEAQKSPELFDAIKAHVDENRKPGQILLLGSTEFSTLLKIKESLTGRMSRVRMYPMSLSETKSFLFSDWNFDQLATRSSFVDRNHITRKDLMKYLLRGGMPGIFAIREDELREQHLRDWIDLTITRDLYQFPKVRLDSDIAMTILEGLARLEVPTASAIAHHSKIDLRRIQSHIHALKTLFVIHTVPPLPGSTGNELCYLLDTSFVEILGGSFHRKLQTWLLNEILIRNSLRTVPRKVHYHRSPKGKIIDFVLTENKHHTAIKIFDKETVSERDFNLLTSFGKKNKNSTLIALSGNDQVHSMEKLEIHVFPWEKLA